MFNLALPCMLAVVMTCNASPAGQPYSGDFNSDTYRIMFYNTENFFDTFDDSLTMDDEYTPRAICTGHISDTLSNSGIRIR